jgi:hypothetical protein
VIVLDLLSGSATPLESMPAWMQLCTQFAPTTHFVSFAQGVLYRAAGLDILWPTLLALAGFTAVFLGVSLMRFRTAIVKLQLCFCSPILCLQFSCLLARRRSHLAGHNSEAQRGFRQAIILRP